MGMLLGGRVCPHRFLNASISLMFSFEKSQGDVLDEKVHSSKNGA